MSEIPYLPRPSTSAWNKPAESVDEKLDCMENQAKEDKRPFDRKAERIAIETGIRRHAWVPDRSGVGHPTQAEADEANKRLPYYQPAEPRAWTPIPTEISEYRADRLAAKTVSFKECYAESVQEEQQVAAQRARDIQLVKEAAEREQKLRTSLRGRFLLLMRRLLRV